MSSTRLAHLLGLLSLSILFSFSFIPNSFAEMVRWPGVILWQIGFILAGLTLLIQLFKNTVYRFGLHLDSLVILTLFFLFLSAWQAPFPKVSAWYLAMSSGYIILSYMLYNLDLKAIQLAYILVSAGTISSILGLVTWFPQRENFDYGFGFQNKLMLGHHNFVGGFVVLLIPLTTALVILCKGWKRWFLIAADLILLIHLYTSSSRGAILGLILAMIISYILFIMHSSRLSGKKILLTLIAILSLCGFLLSQPRIRTLATFQPDTGEMIQVDGNVSYRITLWRTSLHIGKEKPLTGVGLGNLSRVYNFYANEALSGNPIANIHQAHSTFFQILAELGWTGIIIYLLWLCTFTRLWWIAFHGSRINSNSNLEILSSGAGVSLLAYTLTSQTDYQLENIPIALSLCILVIILLKIRDENTRNLNLKFTIPQNRFLRYIIMIMMVAILIIQAPVTYGMFLAYQAKNRYYNKPNLALSKILQSEVWDPSNPIYPLSAAHILQDSLLLMDDPVKKKNIEQKILDHYKTASLLAPYNDFISFNYGYWQLNTDPKKAEIILRKALDQSYAVSDQYYGYHFLGVALLRQGLIAQAIDYLALQALLDPGYLTYQLWKSEELAPIHQHVVNRALDFFSELPIEHFSPENKALMQWWFTQGNDLDKEYFRPIVRFILLWEKEPQRALGLLPLIRDPQQKVVLGAWLNPQAFKDAFSQYLAQASQFSPEIQQQLMDYLTQQPTLRDWLKAPFAQDIWSPGFIGAGLYAFRNTSLSNAFFSHRLIEKLGIPSRLNLWTPASMQDPVIRNFLREHLP